MAVSPTNEKNPYKLPHVKMLDAVAAEAELKAKSAPEDENVQEMLSLIEQQIRSKEQGKAKSSS